ncbi:MAG: N-6 DNA methylase [Nitrospiraceae bacterium]|nr:N-6 DNA methylase [Nitrospiraceae bacterium]
MDKQQAQNIIKDTFENPFDKERFVGFVKNLLNSIEDAPFSYKGNLIPDAYEQYISSLERIGKYTDGGHKIDILIVKLKKKTSIERARTMQRNFIAWYLNGSRGGEMKDAALAAFVSPNEEDWRFSLIKMDYRFEEGKNGRVKVKEEFTPARRWSFLVGKNEKSFTAQSRLVGILADDKYNPTLSELEEAFNIEKVTKEFFEKYRDLFLRTKETLDEIVSANPNIKADFKAKGVNTVDFAKKLLGQIVFLYFLQKKGWFGVQRDADWGTGSKHFLRELFEGRHGAYKNFFNDILEPLFYEALRIDRSHDDGYYSRFNCKIPFLNGGLFDPLNGYDWVKTDILLPNELFSNSIKTKEGDTGTGILDIFDRYNFTVKEDEPLEKEVAVDPEMLGKVFENLLEVKDRKSKGTYYTPREIVHYMCQQSLINYLFTECNISKEDIETLIKYGEQLGENEAAAFIKAQRIAEGKQKGTEIKHLLPESIRQNAKLIDDKLAGIKVCDPAIGSGAFPVGMMSEIVKTRNVLSAFIKDKHRAIYDFKRECIEKSLYGVDIDPGAVEIAKLRLWLSLVVDEDDIKQIKPLPNLDYKIVCGNSLSSVNTLFHHQSLKKLEELKGKYFDETNPGKKIIFKEEIDGLIGEITHNDKHFDYKVYFSEVFNAQGGFDIVIANPPYGVAQQKELKKSYKTFSHRGESYILFIEKGLSILKNGGHFCYIVPDTYLNLPFAAPLRTYLLQNSIIKEIVVLPCRVFDTATVDTTLLFSEKTPTMSTFHNAVVRIKVFSKHDKSFDIASPAHQDSVTTALWYKQGIFNVNTDDNETYLISRLNRQFRSLSYIAEMFYGIKAYQVGKGKPPQTKEIRDTKPFTSDRREHEGFLPFFDGKHIARYVLLWREDNWLNYGPWLAEPRKQSKFVGEKILIRKIVANTLIATYVPDTSYCNTLLYVLKIRHGILVDYLYLLGILNSRFIGWYFHKKFQIASEDTFPQIMISDILEFPIPEVSTDKQVPIIERVEKILADPDSPNVPRLEREIDEMVYKLYGLAEEEIKIVEGRHAPKSG